MALIITTPALLPWTADQPVYNQQITTSGGTPPITMAVSSGSLPPGLSLIGDTVMGTPTASGTYDFSITALDSGSESYTQDYSLKINDLLIFVTSFLPNGIMDKGYGQVIETDGGTPALDFEITDGRLPAGVVLLGPTITGMPNEFGDFFFTITVTDASGAVVSRDFQLHVIACETQLPCTRNGNTTCSILRVYKPDYLFGNFVDRTRDQVAIVPAITSCQQGLFMPTKTEQPKLEPYPLTTQPTIQDRIKQALDNQTYVPPSKYS